MATLDWSQCPAVESIPGKRSGAWVFKDTRMPVAGVKGPGLFWNYARSAESQWLPGSRRGGSRCRAGNGEAA